MSTCKNIIRKCVECRQSIAHVKMKNSTIQVQLNDTVLNVHKIKLDHCTFIKRLIP